MTNTCYIRKFVDAIIARVISDNPGVNRKLCKLCDELGTVLLHNTRRSSHILCDECFIGSYRAKIDELYKTVQQGEFGSPEITCIGDVNCQRMSNMCKQKLSIKNISTNSNNNDVKYIFKKINNMITHLALKDETLLCPSLECGELSPVVKNAGCVFCGITWCTKCKVYPYHNNLACHEYKLSLTNTFDPQIMIDLKSGTIRLCPKCNTGVHRIDGCNAMRCTCGTTFCWLCSIVIAPEGAGHFGTNSCPQFGSA